MAIERRDVIEVFEFNGTTEVEIRVNKRKNRLEFCIEGTPAFGYRIPGKTVSRLTPEDLAYHIPELKAQFTADFLAQIDPVLLKQILTEATATVCPSLERMAKRWATVNSHQANLLSRVALQTSESLKRLRDTIDQPLPIVSWPARNIYELFLWVFYVVKVPGGMLDDEKGILSLMFLDMKELNEGIFEMTENPTPPLREKYRQRQQELQDDADRMEIKIAKKKQRPTTRRLAELVDETLQDSAKTEVRVYNSFYKLTSKFLHPSPYALLHTPSEYIELNFRQTMALRGIHYARQVQEVLWEATRRPNNNEQEGN